jgi:segregation and condensation protein A
VFPHQAAATETGTAATPSGAPTAPGWPINQAGAPTPPGTAPAQSGTAPAPGAAFPQVGTAPAQPSAPALEQDPPYGELGPPAGVGNVGGVTDPEAPVVAVGAGADPSTAVAVDVSKQPGGAAASAAAAAPVGFQVKLINFSGPFDLLLQLIGKQKLEITELSLSQVTDEFISYIRAMGDKWDLDEVSEFLVIAATLLDLKAAKLLPQAEVEDDEDLALLEARDLLFARLLQYKAFKEAASVIAALDAESSRGYPRTVKLEARFAEALPELVLGIGADRLAQLAVKAFGPKPIPVVAIDHVHMVRVSVREHLVILRETLLRLRMATFRALCADCQSTLEVVARFLALLELYREGLVEFDQMTALGELTVRWIGDDAAGLEITIDEYSGERPKNPDGEGAEADRTGTDRAETDGAETDRADTDGVDATDTEDARDTDAVEETRG